MDSYHVVRQVGEGYYGRVYMGRRKCTGQDVALKFIPKEGLSQNELRNLKKEIEILRGLQHPNIVKLYDSFETEKEVVIVTEYAEGQLFQILQEAGHLPESRVREIACQLVSALHYLHSHRILHRDMKPQNILLGKNGMVKLCDFGFARAMSVSTLVVTSIKGTPLYMSPELVEEKPYDHTADLWSLGCILYELHQGEPPFYTNSIIQLVKMIVRDAVRWPDTMSDTFKSFLKGLLTKDPQKRLSWPDLLHHPFVADGVLVMSDESVLSPLVVVPSPDTLALKRLQVLEKTAATSGQSKFLRKVREQRDNCKGEKPLGTDSMKIKKDDMGKERVKSATAAATPRAKPPSSDVIVTSEATGLTTSNEGLNPKNPSHLKSKYRCQLSKDYVQEFLLHRQAGAQIFLEYSQDSLMSPGEDVDSEDDCEEFSPESSTEQDKQLNYTAIIPELKSHILAFGSQLTDGDSRDPQWIHKPLKVLLDLIQTADFEKSLCIGQELGLPCVLFDLISVAVKNSHFMKQPWSVSAMREMIAVLGFYSVKHSNWAIEGQRLEEFTLPFITILNKPRLMCLAPLAASVLSLMIQHNVDVDIDMDLITAVLKGLLLDSYELQQSLIPGWGLFDGLLSLLLHSLHEHENSRGASGFDRVMLDIWKKIGVSLAKTNPDTNFCSVNGLYSFLCAVQFIFTYDPYSCVPLFSEPTSRCVETLCRLLDTDCLRLFAAGGLERSEEDVSHNTVSLLSCQLLCFPFVLDLPSDAMSTVSHLYDSCGVVASLLQVIQSLPIPLLEVPLSLLSYLLLCDPSRSFSHLREDSPFFFTPPKKSHQILQTRTASSLLFELLQQQHVFWDSAEKFLIVLSQVAECYSQHSHRELHIEGSVLQQALSHPHNQIKAATCRLMGNLNPFRSPMQQTLQPDSFQKLIDCLHDSSLPVRQMAIRAVGNWLGHLAAFTMRKSNGKSHDTTLQRRKKEPNKQSGTLATLVERRLNNEEGCRWLEKARRTVPKLVSLIADPDALTRRHCCAALGNLVNFEGVVSFLLEEGAFGLLLRAACTDFHYTVRQAAIETLFLYSREDSVKQVLMSLDAIKRLLKASQYGPPQCDYHRLMALL
ncbi:serine/threonine-protein kinase 36 [Antennarius striatus]|uniref:serine/threonine-protein kinase 36 n=1 Tax=Antennarius striatus TaxID=241820 RepID=UPI0035AF9438